MNFITITTNGLPAIIAGQLKTVVKLHTIAPLCAVVYND